MWTSSGAQPVIEVVSRTPESSSRATTAMAYGRSKAGCHEWWFTVQPTTEARPDTMVGVHDVLRQFGQIGTGWMDEGGALRAALNAKPTVGA